MNNFEDYFFNMPGRIVEYFPENQTATIRICVERSYDSSTDLGSLVARGLLEGVPVHTPSGGGWAMTMPIKVGDTCILFFSQVGYDHWMFEDKDEAKTHGGQPMYWTNRKFDLQDGYALVGLNTLPRAIQSYSPDHSQWRDADATQLISLNSDNSIDIKSPSLVRVTAPNVEVIATTEVKITSPLTSMSGALAVEGNITTQGSMTASGEVTGNGIVLSTHEHAGDGGSGSGPTTGPPQ